MTDDSRESERARGVRNWGFAERLQLISEENDEGSDVRAKVV